MHTAQGVLTWHVNLFYLVSWLYVITDTTVHAVDEANVQGRRRQVARVVLFMSIFHSNRSLLRCGHGGLRWAWRTRRTHGRRLGSRALTRARLPAPRLPYPRLAHPRLTRATLVFLRHCDHAHPGCGYPQGGGDGDGVAGSGRRLAGRPLAPRAPPS